MPYIKQKLRKDVDPYIQDVFQHVESPGDLNYVITSLCLKYLRNTEENYIGYNTIIGTLECAKLEFYRRAVATYEDKKVIENGDVY